MAENNCRLEILVQPQDVFRYCTFKDPRHGSLKGINDQEITVKLEGFMGKESDIIVLCTIYHFDEAYGMYPHPNRLLIFDQEGDTRHRFNLDPIKSYLNDWKATFSNMVIIRTRNGEISSTLEDKLNKIRQYKPEYLINPEPEINIDNINFDMKKVKLCFEAYEKKGELYFPICEPQFSNNICYFDRFIHNI